MLFSYRYIAKDSFQVQQKFNNYISRSRLIWVYFKFHELKLIEELKIIFTFSICATITAKN